MLYWQVGMLLRKHVVQGVRAEYGKQMIERLAADLTEQYGEGWSHQQLWHCLRTAETFSEIDPQILATLWREMSRSQLKVLIDIDEPLEREFYMEMARHERWSVRQLNDRIRSMLYERTAISKKPEATIVDDLRTLRHEGRVSADLAFRDPKVLDFLGLADTYSEHDLESAILAELQRFIAEELEVADYSFNDIARVKRACRIDRVVSLGGYRNPESEWPAIQAAIVDAMTRFEKTLSPQLDLLDLQ